MGLDPSDPDTINIEGTIRYLQALGLDPEEPVVLVLAYQLDSPSIGIFTRQGFVEGWRTIGYDPTPSPPQSPSYFVFFLGMGLMAMKM